MNAILEPTIKPSVCPLDCPDTCSLSVKVADDRVIGVRGSYANPYTAGAVCEKVAKYYPEFVHGEYRLHQPLRRTGERGSGEFEPISWDRAMDLVYQGIGRAIEQFGPQSVLPLNYAGPHGLISGGSMDLRFFHRVGRCVESYAVAPTPAFLDALPVCHPNRLPMRMSSRSGGIMSRCRTCTSPG